MACRGVWVDRKVIVAGIILATLGAIGLVGSMHEAFTDGSMGLWEPILESVGLLGLGIALLILAYLEDRKKAL